MLLHTGVSASAMKVYHTITLFDYLLLKTHWQFVGSMLPWDYQGISDFKFADIMIFMRAKSSTAGTFTVGTATVLPHSSSGVIS
jgi:hypothetical protein